MSHVDMLQALLCQHVVLMVLWLPKQDLIQGAA